MVNKFVVALLLALCAAVAIGSKTANADVIPMPENLAGYLVESSFPGLPANAKIYPFQSVAGQQHTRYVWGAIFGDGGLIDVPDDAIGIKFHFADQNGRPTVMHIQYYVGGPIQSLPMPRGAEIDFLALFKGFVPDIGPFSLIVDMEYEGHPAADRMEILGFVVPDAPAPNPDPKRIPIPGVLTLIGAGAIIGILGRRVKKEDENKKKKNVPEISSWFRERLYSSN
jgi:hypothetical protein